MKYNKGPKRSPFRPRGSGVGNDKGRKVGTKGKKARVTSGTHIYLLVIVIGNSNSKVAKNQVLIY